MGAPRAPRLLHATITALHATPQIAMEELTREDRDILGHIAHRHGFSTAATACMLEAVAGGSGTMAQFSHPEFGGSGQWMRGGMTMVADMFNHQLKARVDALCTDLSDLLASRPALLSRVQPGGGEPWWPRELGSPDSAGAQNDRRYAYFAGQRRLAVDEGGRVTVYDTQEHRIAGFSQQQSGSASTTFTSQDGPVALSRLPVVWSNSPRPPTPPAPPTPPTPPTPPAAGPGQTTAPLQHDAIALIERLADLRAKGVLTEDEFQAKKTELLGRL
jgi:hypothetical protein